MSSIFEFETWKIRPGVSQDDHDEAIRGWFRWVAQHQPQLFAEWRGARYFRELGHETDDPTGRFIMLFEYASPEARRAYKERRADFTGPYAEYKTVDPYQRVFDLGTVTSALWAPAEEDHWLDFTAGQWPSR